MSGSPPAVSRPPESAVRGAALATIASAVFVASGYAVNVWLGRLLGPVDYGRFGVILALMTVLNVVQSAAIPQATARFVAQSPESGPGILRRGVELQLLIAFTLTILLAGLAPVISELLGDEALTDLLRLMALILPPYGLFTLLVAFHNGRRAYTRQVLTQGAYSVAKVTMAIGLAYPLQLMGAIGGYVLAPLAAIAVGWQRLWAPRAALPYRAILAFAAPVSVHALGSVGQLNVDIFFVKALAPDSGAAGYYAAAQSLSRIPYFLLSGLAFILLPAVAAAAARGGPAVRSTTARAIRAATLIVVPAAMLVALTSGPLIELFYSPSYAPGAGPLALLSVGMGVLALASVAASVLIGVGKTALTAATSLIGVAITVVLCLVLIPPLGGVGAALATTAGATTSLAVLAGLMVRHVPHAIPVASVARIALSTAIVGALVWAIPARGPWLLAVYGAAALIGLGLLVLFREVDAGELRMALAALRRRRDA